MGFLIQQGEFRAFQASTGQSTTIVLLNAAKSQSFSFLAFGFGNLGNLGAFTFPGTPCVVYVNPMINVHMPTSGQGTGAFTFLIPGAALGSPLFVQQWAASPGSNPLGLVLSDAFAAVVK